MKRLILLCALIASAAHAQTTLVAQTEAGGAIVLTDKADPKCDAGSRHMFIMSKTGQVFQRGCWSYTSGLVLALFHDGTSRVYMTTAFTQVKGGAQ